MRFFRGGFEATSDGDTKATVGTTAGLRIFFQLQIVTKNKQRINTKLGAWC